MTTTWSPWSCDHILGTLQPLWLFATSHNHMATICDLFWEVGSIYFRFPGKKPSIWKMDLLNDFGAFF